MQPHKHFLIGGLAAIAPDVFLLVFGWRKLWIPESNKYVKFHRYLHSQRGLIAVWILGWTTHIILDWFSKHRSEP